MARPRDRSLVVWLATLTLASTVAFAEGSTAAGSRAARIRGFANRWLGTPYVWGGDGKGGIDCSAYLRQMFRDLFNVEVPRTTRTQIDLGMDVRLNPNALEQGLQIGDLFFFIDREGVPNHVVVYMGAGQITHSVSGRGVVIDPMKYLWGRRIVGRRLFSGAGGDSGTYQVIPAAGPIVPIEIPCPPSVVAKTLEVRRFKTKPLGDLRSDLGDLDQRGICDFRALANALRKDGGDVAKRNALVLDQHALWLESLNALKDTLDHRR